MQDLITAQFSSVTLSRVWKPPDMVICLVEMELQHLMHIRTLTGAAISTAHRQNLVRFTFSVKSLSIGRAQSRAVSRFPRQMQNTSLLRVLARTASLRCVLSDLDLHHKEPSVVHEDNTAAIKWSSGSCWLCWPTGTAVQRRI
jgi:hypothetical protein